MIGLFLLAPLSELLRYTLIYILFFSYPIRPGKGKYIYISISLFLFSLLSQVKNISTINVMLLMLLLVFTSTLFIFKEKFHRIFLTFFLAGFATVVWDNLVYTIYSKNGYLPDLPNTLIRTSLNSLTLVPFLVILLLYLKKKGHFTYPRKNIIPIKIYVFIFIGFFMSSIIISIFRYITINDNYMEFPLFIITTITIIYIVICLMILFLYNSREKYKLISEIRDQFTAKQIEYYKALLVQDEDIRKFRHDIRNHFICIYELLDANKIDDVKEYINGLYDTIDKSNAIYDTGNDILNAVINYYNNLGKEMGIQLLVHGRMLADCKIQAMHLCTIASNVLSNAFEATLKADEELEKTIKIDLKCGTKFFEFTVNNPTEINRAKLTNHIRTSKTDSKNHGFGIQNIKEIVSLYDGDFHLHDYGDNVTAQVILKLY